MILDSWHKSPHSRKRFDKKKSREPIFEQSCFTIKIEN